MVGVRGGQVAQSALAAGHAGKSSSDTRWLLGALMVIIGIGAIVGIVVTLSMGLTNVALAIGIVGCAFFARAWC